MADDPSPWRSAPPPSADNPDSTDARGEQSPWLPPRTDAQAKAPRSQGLDDLLSHKAFGPELPRLPGGSKLWPWSALAVAALWLTTGINILQPGEAGVVTRLGQYHRTLEAGTHFTAPLPIERVTVVPVRSEQTLSLGSDAGPMLTADGALATLGYSLRWSVIDPRAYLFRVAEPDTLLKRSAWSAMRAAVAQRPFADLARPEVRAALAQEVQRDTQRSLDQLGAGVRIGAVNVATITPPSEVAAAFESVTKARADADAAIREARRDTVASVDRVQRDADSFNRLLIQYQAAPQATRSRLYYETMERILTPVPKVVGTEAVAPPAGAATVSPAPSAATATPRAPEAKR